MPQIIFTWHTHQDERTCLVCGALHGRQWRFFSSDAIPHQLTHPTFGIIYNVLNDEPLTHGKGSRAGPWNCRCRVSWDINTEDLEDDLRRLRQDLRMLNTETEKTVRLVAGIV